MGQRKKRRCKTEKSEREIQKGQEESEEPDVFPAPVSTNILGDSHKKLSLEQPSLFSVNFLKPRDSITDFHDMPISNLDSYLINQ